MPFVDLKGPDNGDFSFRYTIATPASNGAKSIIPDVPCIIFFHSGYIASEVFEMQFADSNLRQFNLIAIDMRGFGHTKGTIRDAHYTPTEIARDIEQIMTKLDLPPCHIFGLSLGCSVALELAVSNPDKVLSLTLCSPLPPEEPVEIASGQLEVYRYWVLMDESNEEEDPDINLELVGEVMTGATQLLYSTCRTNRVEAIADFALASGKRICSGTAEKLQQSYKANIECFLQRKPIPEELLAKIKGPVRFIHCLNDVAYPLQYAQAWTSSLQNAGLSNVSLREVEGSHYGNVTDPEKINQILYENVVSCHPNLCPNVYLSTKEGSERMHTPFTDTLMLFGYDPTDDYIQ